MNKVFINKDQIAREVSAEVSLPINKVLALMEEFEGEIANALKEKERVKLTRFGIFYLISRKSRTIRQIGSLHSRLLIERKAVKFRAAEPLKAKLSGRPTAARANKPVAAPTVETVKVYEPKIIKETPPPVKMPRKLLKEFKPLAIMSRVEKGKIKDKIYQKMLELGAKQEPELKEIQSTSLPTHRILQTHPEERIFASIFKQVLTLGADNIHFALNEQPATLIYYNRPKQLLAKVPRDLVQKFLENVLELTHLNMPQERATKIILETALPQSFFLNVYSLPHESGASLYFKILRRKIENK